jgi:hypothetical protein
MAKTFINEALTEETLDFYRKISKDRNIPLRVVATLGATESGHGSDTRVESMGNTRGVFHITKAAALDGVRKVLKDKALYKELEKLSEDDFRDKMFSDKDLEAKLAGGYIKLAHNRAKGDPKKTYGFYNAGVFRNLEKKPFNSIHKQNQKNFMERYEDSEKYSSRFGAYSEFPSDLLDLNELGEEEKEVTSADKAVAVEEARTGNFKTLAKTVAEKPVTETLTRMPFKKAFDMARSLGLK